MPVVGGWRRWKTKSYSTRWCRFSTRSGKRTFWIFHTGSGRGAALTRGEVLRVALSGDKVCVASAPVVNALDALYVGITSKKVNFVLDLDIRSFFDKVGHDRMEKFVRQRIGDERLVRLILKWLKAGVMEDGQWFETKEGTPDQRRR